MALTKEYLLIKRYQCIADYPQQSYNKGDEHIFIEGDLLIEGNVNGAMTFIRTGRLGYMSVGVPCCAHPERYPKIFQPLPWWKYRDKSDLPDYVRLEGGYVHKVESWIGNNCAGQPLYEYYNLVGTLMTACVSDLIPADEQEYADYINSRKNEQG